MNELKFINQSTLKFRHSKEGVIASYKGKKFILGFLSVMNKGVSLSDEDFINLGKAILESQCLIRGFPRYVVEDSQIISPVLAHVP